jgi:pyruvate kinase
MLETSRAFAREHGLGAEGDSFVVTAGVPFHTPGTTNYMRVETL